MLGRHFFVLLASFATVSSPAWAACTSPDGARGAYLWDGGVAKFCNSSDVWVTFLDVETLSTCNKAGQLEYDSSEVAYKYCDGTDWHKTGCFDFECDTIGEVCEDGSVYSGITPDGSVKMYARPSDVGARFYNDGSTNYVNTAMTNCTAGSGYTENSCTTGKANTTFLAGLSNGESPYQAATDCESLIASGHSDWYLPAINEILVLYTNRVAIGGFNLGGGQAGVYWSSSEVGTTGAQRINFQTGVVGTWAKEGTLKVRCVRNESVNCCPNLGACTKAGEMKYMSGVLAFCAGTRWVSFGLKAGTC
jgi:hypothetical protein